MRSRPDPGAAPGSLRRKAEVPVARVGLRGRGCTRNASVGHIDASGTITEYPLPSGMYPSGIAMGADGNLWVTGVADPQASGWIGTDDALGHRHIVPSSTPQPADRHRRGPGRRSVVHGGRDSERRHGRDRAPDHLWEPDRVRPPHVGGSSQRSGRHRGRTRWELVVHLGHARRGADRCQHRTDHAFRHDHPIPCVGRSWLAAWGDRRRARRQPLVHAGLSNVIGRIMLTGTVTLFRLPTGAHLPERHRVGFARDHVVHRLRLDRTFQRSRHLRCIGSCGWIG